MLENFQITFSMSRQRMAIEKNRHGREGECKCVALYFYGLANFPFSSWAHRVLLFFMGVTESRQPEDDA